MTPDQLTDLAQRAGIPTDSPRFTALQLTCLQGLSVTEAARQAGLARKTVAYALQRVEWVRAAQGNPTPKPAGRHSPTADKRMTPEQLDALCDLAGRIGNGPTRAALRHFYVGGHSQSASALLANVHASTMSNARRLIELQQARLPALLSTAQTAMGES